MARTMVNIGKTLYLFKCNENDYARRCVISAHGGIDQKKQTTFPVPADTTFFFYSQHGDPAGDFGIRHFIGANTDAKIQDRLVGNSQCYNYSLSKYQGKHNESGETYESIQETQARIAEYDEMLKNADPEKLKNVGVVLVEPFDVVTVRNRFWISGVDLKDLIEKIHAVHHYPEYHCFFCRSFM